MANDCLVKRLKGVVDNDNLLKLGEMRIKCSTTACGGTTTEAMRTIEFSGGGLITAEGKTFKVKPYTEGSAYQEVTEFDASDGNEYKYVFPDGEYNISIGNKYNIYGFADHDDIASSPFFSFNLKDLAYDAVLWFIFAGHHYGITGELKYIDTQHVSGIKLNDYFSPNTNKAYMNINMLKDSVTLTTLYLYGRWNSEEEQSYGSINNIKSPALVQMFINNSKITGDVNTMIQNMVAAGRTSGSFYMQGNSLVTVNGTPFIEYRNSLPGTDPGIRFTIDLNAPNNWIATRG